MIYGHFRLEITLLYLFLSPSLNKVGIFFIFRVVIILLQCLVCRQFVTICFFRYLCCGVFRHFIVAFYLCARNLSKQSELDQFKLLIIVVSMLKNSSRKYSTIVLLNL